MNKQQQIKAQTKYAVEHLESRAIWLGSRGTKYFDTVFNFENF